MHYFWRKLTTCACFKRLAGIEKKHEIATQAANVKYEHNNKIYYVASPVVTLIDLFEKVGHSAIFMNSLKFGKQTITKT